MFSSLDRIAVFVDGDNICNKYAHKILDVSREYGQADVVRVYGNGTCLTGWAECAGFEYIFSGQGKNSADILLSIDAIELALSRTLESVVIVSSDGDFSHLATRLRARGVPVVGLGEAKAPDVFRQACSVFRELREDNRERQVAPAKSVLPIGKFPTDLDQTIRKVIAAHSTQGMGMRIAELSPIMHLKHGLKISKLPERNWRSYLSKRPALYDLDPKGPEAKVRFKPQGFDNGDK